MLEEVVEILRTCGVNATEWDSGGGMVGIAVCRGDAPPDEASFYFGDADTTWAAEVLDEEGNQIGDLPTGVDTESEDPNALAAGILQALAEYALSLPRT